MPRVRHVSSLWLWPAFAFLIGCSNAQPGVETFSSLSGPNFSGSSATNYTITSASQSVTVSAQCDKRITTVQVSLDGGSSWQAPPTGGEDFDCSDGTLSFVISNAGTYLGFTSGIQSSKSFLLRGLVATNATSSSTVTVDYVVSSGSTVTLSGQPSSPSNTLTLNITAGGTGITQYKYKVGASGSTDCTVSTGYSSAVAVATPITNSISAVSDGTVVVCAVGSDGSTWQSYSAATSVSWTKDATTPSLAFSSPAASTAGISGLTISGTCEAGLTVNLSGLGLQSPSTTSCSSGTFSQAITFTAGDGTKAISIAQTDAAGNTGSTSRSFVKDSTGPTVTLNQAGGQADPTNSLPISFTVVFNEAISVASFTTADITNSGTATVTGWNIADSGDHMTFTLTATTISTDGTVIPSLAAAAVTDALGNTGSASTSTDNTVTYDSTVPSVNLVTSSTVNGTYTASDTITIQLQFSEAVYVAAGTPTLTVETGTTDETVGYSSGSGTTTLSFTYTVSGGDLSSDLELASPTLNLNGATVKDAAGNTTSLALPTSGSQSLSFNKDLVIIGTPAALSVSDGPTYDYGSVLIGQTASKTFTVTNTGGYTAGSISPTPSLAAPFSYSGGSYPGGGTCGATLAAGASCTVIVNFNPNATGSFSDSISLQYNNGISTVASTRAVQGTGVAIAVYPVYSGSSNWNDYVKFDNASGGTNIYDQSGTNCSGSETGYYNELGGCIHAGELRKVVVPTYSSCTNLTITDNLGAFNWTCISNATTGNVATFFTNGFASGKGLRNLITTGGAWQNMSVNVKLSGSSIGTTTAMAWWTNPITNLSTLDNSATASVINLTTAGTIYFTTSTRATFGYQITADRVAVVTWGSAQLKKYGPTNTMNCNTSDGTTNPTTNTQAVLFGGSRKFIWVEANIDGFTGATWPAYNGLFAFAWNFSRIHRTTVSPTHSSNAFYAVSLNNSSGNLITGLEIYDVASGFELAGAGGSDKNIVRNLSVGYARYGNANCKSVSVPSGSDSNRFYDLRISNHASTHTSSKAFFLGGTSNVISRTNISNVFGMGEGLYFNTGAAYNIVTQLVATNANDAGIYMTGTVSNNLIMNYTSANNVYNGIYFNSGTYTNNSFGSLAIANTDKAIQSASSSMSGTGNTFFDMYIANNNTWSSDLYGMSATVLHYFIDGDSCATVGIDLCSLASSNYHSGGDLTSAFQGAVTSNDTLNPSDTNGASSIAISVLGGWLYFDNWLRGWGKSGTFPNTGIQGYASSPTYQIWDWRAASGDNIHNRSYDGQSANGTLNIDNMPCVNNTVSSTDTLTAAGITFLRNAIEIDGDRVGNDNSLCEASEDCIWSPNIGAYQGMGALSSGYCTVNGGGLSGIRVFKYTTN